MPKIVVMCDCHVDGKLTEFARTQFCTGPRYGDSTDSTIFLECNKCPNIFKVNICQDEAIVEDKISIYSGELSKEQLRKWIPLESGSYYEKTGDKKIKRRMEEIEEEEKKKKELHSYCCCFALRESPDLHKISEFEAASNEDAHAKAREDASMIVLWVARKI